jgi:hypothetical protein
MLISKQQMRRDPTLFLCKLNVGKGRVAKVIAWCEQEQILSASESLLGMVSVVCTEPQLTLIMLKFSGGAEGAV